MSEGPRFVTFLIDLGNVDGDGDRVLGDSLAFAPNRERPRSAFAWKVSCDMHGSVLVSDESGAEIGRARWADGLGDALQVATAPTAHQWTLIATALAQAHARASGAERCTEPVALPPLGKPPRAPRVIAFLLELSGSDANRMVEGALRYAEQTGPLSESESRVRVTVASGHVRVERAARGIIATATWDGGELAARTGALDEFQWELVRVALAAAGHAGSPAMTLDPSVTPPGVSPPPVVSPSTGTPVASSTTSAIVEVRPATTPQPLHISANPPRPASPHARAADEERRLRKRRVVGIAVFSGICLFVVAGLTLPWYFSHRDKQRYRAELARSRELSAARPTPTAEPAPAPIAASHEFFTGHADTLETRLAAHRLRWSDVEGAAETTVARAEKEPAQEQGKRLCVAGTLTHITRADQGATQLYAGALTTEAGDRVTFLASGATGELEKRSAATLCGVVTGYADGAIAVEGLFDLPANRNPVVEAE